MEKNEQIKAYATNLFALLEVAGIYLKPEEKDEFVKHFLDREESLETIISAMNEKAMALRGSHDQRNRQSAPQDFVNMGDGMIPDVNVGIGDNLQLGTNVELTSKLREKLGDALQFGTRRGEDLSYPEQPNVPEEEGRKLTFRPPKGNGFVDSLMVAVVIGSVLGILIAFVFISLK